MSARPAPGLPQKNFAARSQTASGEGEKVKVKVNYGKCVIAVKGVDMPCPLCKVLVVSGTTHQCEQKEPRKARPAARGK